MRTVKHSASAFLGSILCSQIALAQTGGAPQPLFNPLTEKIVIALVSATLSLITGYVLYQVKERREPKKRVSYDLKTRRGLVAAEDSIARHLAVTYKGLPAEKITFVACDVKNSGNTVTKDQYLRFDFGEGTRILDLYAEPIPPREYGFEFVESSPPLEHEKRVKIQHLEKQQNIGLRFVLSEAADSETKIYPYNDAGDVEVIPGSVSRAADDRRQTEQFLFIFILLSTVPTFFYRLPSFLEYSGGVAQLILVLALLPLVRPFARTLAQALSTAGRPALPSIEIREISQGSQAELKIFTGDTVYSQYHHPTAPETSEPDGPSPTG